VTSSLPILVDAPAPRPVHVPGPLEKSLAELWPVARKRVDTFKYWRETLRLRRRFSVRMLRLRELSVKIPAGKTPDCDSCVDICCTGPNAIVSLRLRDIAALVDAGLDHAIVPREKRPPPPSSSWARREADGSVFHEVFPVLARDERGTCKLLDGDRMCSAFPHWPLSCARYPYALDLQAKVIFYAKGCASSHEVPLVDAPIKVRELVHAVVDAYNERVKDAVLLHVARPELDALGVTKFLDLSGL
jgi:Fe-S-cluster containining protein